MEIRKHIVNSNLSLETRTHSAHLNCMLYRRKVDPMLRGCLAEKHLSPNRGGLPISLQPSAKISFAHCRE